jgi:hypothetical protein
MPTRMMIQTKMTISAMMAIQVVIHQAMIQM